jgi:hypothetical protein
LEGKTIQNIEHGIFNPIVEESYSETNILHKTIKPKAE